MPHDDLWGDLPEVQSLRTPLVILKEQSELLNEKTEGLLVGEIKQSQNGTKFVYELMIVAPTLNNYTYHLLTAIHDIGFYPVRLIDRMISTDKGSCSNEEEYKNGLRDIFSSEKNKNVISKLLTHINSQE